MWYPHFLQRLNNSFNFQSTMMVISEWNRVRYCLTWPLNFVTHSLNITESIIGSIIVRWHSQFQNHSVLLVCASRSFQTSWLDKKTQTQCIQIFLPKRYFNSVNDLLLTTTKSYIEWNAGEQAEKLTEPFTTVNTLKELVSLHKTCSVSQVKQKCCKIGILRTTG